MLVSPEVTGRKAGLARIDAPERLSWRINDACAALGISRSHLYDLAAAGKVKFIKIGGRTVVPDAEVQRLASEGA
jgi:excisionase family DNA binding protein